MSYHNRLSHESRRAQDHTPDDGIGLLRCGLVVIAVIALVLWVVA